MMIDLLLLLVGGALLAKSADWMVEFAARVARRFGVSNVVIGLTLTSVGTSIPELASSVSATLQGHTGLALGNVTGSNIANVGLIVGIAALVRPLDTDRKIYDRDGFVLLAASVGLFMLVLDNRLGRLDATLLFVSYVAYIVFLARTDQADADHRFRGFVDFVFDFGFVEPLTRPIRALRSRATGNGPVADASNPPWWWLPAAGEAAVALACCAGVALGARLFVASAAEVATAIGLPDAVVGLSLLALGTSLPELSVAVSAARRGNTDLVVGNVIGSNIANVMLILGACGLLRPLEVSELSVVYTVPIMLFFSVGLLYVVRSDWQISRAQGALAVACYVAFLAVAVAEGWS